MSNLRLILFECKKQITSFTFLIILAIFTVFAVTQLNEIFHLPVKSDNDIRALEQSGERDYIYIENTDADLKSETIEHIQQKIADGTIPQDSAEEFDVVLEMLKNNNYSFKDILSAMQNNKTISTWLSACKVQFSKHIGSVDEVNSNIQSALGNTGYSPNLYVKYVTYMQAIAGFLIFPIFLLLFTRDYQHNMFEAIYVQPLSSTRYILSRYFGTLIPLIVYLYLFGLVLNLNSVSRFIGAGYEYQYTAFFPYFIIYILPTVFFLSSLITLLMLVINKAVAVFPIYIIYVIFNVTPNAFSFGGAWIRMINPIIRLDRQLGSMEVVLINRLVYMILGVFLLVIACKVYNKLRNNLRKVISI